jgi:hypothetical protein
MEQAFEYIEPYMQDGRLHFPLTNDHWTNHLVSFHVQIGLYLFVFDMILRLILRKTPSTRWNYVHAFGNSLVCYYSLPHMILLLSDPIHEILHPHFFNDSASIITMIHTYHVIAFKCRFDEWMHHICFVLLGTLTQYTVNWGRIAALYHFFICGLPGGIDYFILGLVKDGIVTKERRLRIAVELNTWIRAPGIIVAWAFAWTWLMHSPMQVRELLCFVAISFGSVFNAQFYARQVTLAAGKQLGIQ